MFRTVNISFPILIVVLLTTLVYPRTKFVEKPTFKYFLIVQFMLVTFVVNILLPKHGILMWAACVVVANHYYSTKASIFTFVLASILMLVAIYLGMLFGEWDANLLNGAYYIEVGGESVNVDNASFSQRMKWLEFLQSGNDNRYFKAFAYYYLPRFLTLLVVENTCIALSKRSLNLLILESKNTIANTKMKSELNVAKEIQYSVLPKALDDENKDNIYGLMDPAKEVGGDFYDYFYIDDSHIALVIADVSGKGIPASLFMMKTATLVKSLTLSFKHDTAKILERCNVSLSNNNEASIFVTWWLGIVNLSSGELRYTNAGHNKIILIHDGKPIFLNDKSGLVLGAFSDTKYTENVIHLEKSDKLVLYTDGITEAHDIENKLYGEDRLLRFTKENVELDPKDFVTKLRESVAEYSKGVEQFDDITILMFKYNLISTITESKIFNADVKELDNLFNYSSTLLKMLDFSNRDIIMINTALEEVFVNVASYAYEKGGTVEVTLSKYKDHIKFVFKDNGKPFNPLDMKDPNITASSEDREIGGLGIYMVKKIMDDVSYEYINNQNILTLIKYKKA